MNKNISTFIGCEGEYEQAKLVLFGAPFDCTTSYRPGTRFASSAMRSESFAIETYSPYQDKDLEDLCVFDGGDLELPFGNADRALSRIEEYAARVLGDGKLPCMIGGEHLVTLGAVRAAVKKYPELHIIHFDAHADLREDYLGGNAFPRDGHAQSVGACGRRPDFPVWHPFRRAGGVYLGARACIYA